MPVYQYSALNASGKVKKGTMEGDSERTVRAALRAQLLNPLSIEIVTEASLTKRSVDSIFKPGVSVADLALITRQLATMLTAGIPLEEVLLSVAEQSEKNHHKSILLAVRGKVMEGYSLAIALKEFPKVFDNLYCATVAAGEKTGHLDTVLERLASFTERRQEVRQKISKAMVYPSIVILAALGIVSFLLLNVVPKMLGVFAQTGQMLPLATRILLTISDGLGHYGFYLLGLLAVGVFLFIRLMRGIPFRVGVEKLLFKIALVGKAIRLINTARFSHTLAILTAAGVDVIEAMRVATNIIGNISIRRKLEIATRQVSEGVAIHRALKETGFFPPMSIYLIASGENSGQLEDMLERAARMQENQVERTIDILLTVFEPLMILIMGSMVLFIVLAILLPIFDLDQFIQ